MQEPSFARPDSPRGCPYRVHRSVRLPIYEHGPGVPGMTGMSSGQKDLLA